MNQEKDLFREFKMAKELRFDTGSGYVDKNNLLKVLLKVTKAEPCEYAIVLPNKVMVGSTWYEPNTRFCRTKIDQLRSDHLNCHLTEEELKDEDKIKSCTFYR